MPEHEKTYDYTGPTVEDAIEKGLDTLHLDLQDIEIEVLEEGSKGLFGLGSKEAVVRLHIKKGVRLTRIPESDEVLLPIPDAPGSTVESDQPEHEDDADGIVSIARDTVKELLEKMHVQANVQAKLMPPDDHSNRPAVTVDISGDDLSILIGRKAETLQALEYITRLIVGKEVSGSVIVNLDVQGYKKRKEQRLRRIAQSVARQAIETGRRQYLEPMPASERRIVHMELRDHPEVYTESVGEGFRRKVTINPRN